MKEFIKKNWFKIVIIIILIIIITIYYQTQQTALQIKKEKQEADYKMEKAEFLLKTEKEERIKEEELERKENLEWCLETAEDAYWGYVKLNGTLIEDETEDKKEYYESGLLKIPKPNPKTYRASQDVWDEAAKRKELIEDKCFKQYK